MIFFMSLVYNYSINICYKTILYNIKISYNTCYITLCYDMSKFKKSIRDMISMDKY